MSVKDRFTTEEWAGIMQAPMLAGLAVTAADPGGLWGAIKESSAVARGLVEAKMSEDTSPILQDIIAAFETSEGRHLVQDGVKELIKGKKPGEATAAAVKRLGEIGAVVEAKSPEHAAAYRDFLKATALKVAEASKEGGFLGFGGEQISEAETKTLADLDAVLG